MPVVQRNRTYFIEEAIIRGMGSGHPETEVPGVIDIVFSTGTETWAPDYPVQENS